MRLESLWGDIRFAFRIFKRSPAVALTVIGTLAVALGLNATAYSFFNAYVVKPAAVHDPGTLYQASWENRGGFFHRFSWTEAEGFGRDMAGVFPETYVSMPQLLTRINGRPAMGELVTGNYFSLLGVPAFRGRMLRPSDSAAPGREPVVVLSHAAWMRLFGGDPAAVGQQLQIRGVYRRDCRHRSRRLRRPGRAPPRLLGAADDAARARRGAEPLRARTAAAARRGRTPRRHADRRLRPGGGTGLGAACNGEQSAGDAGRGGRSSSRQRRRSRCRSTCSSPSRR